ncbi:allergen [Anopheles darlingi]|uniref:Allergen n=1 Tax=Anopheles darlingi TaxID=43151 RepID=W5JMR0_ANODA|nr:allergen [Anopheles darlingi]
MAAIWEGKKYKMEKSEGFDDYMKALVVLRATIRWLFKGQTTTATATRVGGGSFKCVGMVLRKLGNSISPTVELVKNGDEYTFNTLSTFKNTTIKFKLGEEFDEETVDGRTVKSVCTFDGNKLIHEQKGEKPTTIVREFTATDLTATMTAGNAKCVRYYKAI